MEIQQNSNKKFFILSGALSGVLMLLVITTFILSAAQQRTPTRTNIAASNENNSTIKTENIELGQNAPNTQSNQNKHIAQASPLPQVLFQSWVTGPRPQQTPATSTVYSLKQNYTFEEIKQTASLFKSSDLIKRTGEYILSYTQPGKNPGSLIVFNTKTGQFSYASTEGVPLTTEPGADFNTNVYQFLKQMELYDTTLKVSATYRDHRNPNVLYVELHRDWKEIGGPILNPVGLLNLPEELSLANLTIATENEELPEDENIHNTSDNRDGRKRPNDFNTLTIGIRESTNSVVSVRSNIRKLTESKVNTNLISFEDAQNKLQNGEQEFILTVPSGSGDIPWDRIYTDNKATSPQATITDTFFTYLERSPGSEQSHLSPYYIFRGFANLDNGYRVAFTAAVPANQNSQPNARSSWSFIKEVFAQDDTGQKQGTFDLSPGPSLTPLPIDTTSCVPSVNQLNPVYEINGVRFGWSNIRLLKGEIKTSRKGWYYLIPGTGTSVSSLRNEVNQVIIQVRSISGENDFREFDKILDDYQQYGNTCPVRVTGASPALFIYGNPGDTYEVKPSGHLTYADPPTNNQGVWDVTISDAHTLLIEGKTRNYLYYEYTPKHFTKPSTGWNVKRSDIPEFVKTTLSPEIGLNEIENERMIQELLHAAEDVDGTSVFLGVIDSDELEQKLPIILTPRPEKIYRYHIYVGTAKQNKPEKPVITPLTRSTQMVLELGAVSE